MHRYYNLRSGGVESCDIANPGTTKRGRVGMIGGALAPFGVGLGCLRGSIAPMTDRGGVVGQCPGPVARGIVDRGGVDVMSENPALFKPGFL